ncbi:hypothetical protein C8J98_11074 [Luteibacter sp. OK325]|uniref:hypothetical protein n=1 Tax=Luteibacter sp. OK325 TaxID=2135670 RepID=UPI000D33194A|nr:hypothetical protein [Luteibacter sp. OK325]PTR26344.1 hypothetical protein C8J98_11074 [Luteibacter sp. OK325]
MKYRASIVVALLLSGCATYSVTNEWKDPSWSGPPATNVLVIGVARSDTMRRLFEDTFARDLSAAGVRAQASYAAIPSGHDGSAKLGDVVRSTGSDAVLVTRVQRVEDRINVTPRGPGPGYGGFYGWYGGAWDSTPEITQTTVVTLETSLWDVRSQKLVWTVTTQGLASNDIPKATNELSKTLIPKMKADGVIR